MAKSKQTPLDIALARYKHHQSDETITLLGGKVPQKPAPVPTAPGGQGKSTVDAKSSAAPLKPSAPVPVVSAGQAKSASDAKPAAAAPAKAPASAPTKPAATGKKA